MHPDKKLVGCYPVYTPVELIHAAGMLPVGVIGAGNRLEIAHADSRFQSFICSIVKSTLELGLTENLNFSTASSSIQFAIRRVISAASSRGIFPINGRVHSLPAEHDFPSYD